MGRLPVPTFTFSSFTSGDKGVRRPMSVPFTNRGTPQRDDKPLPHNAEAERNVLGSILLDNTALAFAKAIVEPVDFYRHANRLIFSAMLKLAEQLKPIDTVMLMDALGDKLESAGGTAYLSSLPDGIPRFMNIEHHARVVRNMSGMRELLYAAAEIQIRVHDTDRYTAEGIAAKAAETFAKLSEVQNADDSDLFDTWEEYQNTKPLRSLIEGVFQADVCNIIGGLSGDGKTLILFAITKALLTGKPLFGYFKVLEPVERVIYLIPECARAPFLHRAKLFGLERFLENGRLKTRTLSKGLRIPLNDPRLLRAVKGTVIQIDTAVRFSTGDENDAGTISTGLATDIFGLLSAGAVAAGAAHHSAKNFEKESRISLENVLRGSGDIGAFVGAGFGIRQIDEAQNIIHLEDIKPREAELFPPFQIIGRPYIDREGDFRMWRKPGACGRLAEYFEAPGRNQGGAPPEARDNRLERIELVRGWMLQDPNLTGEDLVERFAKVNIKVSESAARKYRLAVAPRRDEGDPD
jgi:hypothetical protein